MDRQRLLHMAIKENYFDIRVLCWADSLPMYLFQETQLCWLLCTLSTNSRRKVFSREAGNISSKKPSQDFEASRWWSWWTYNRSAENHGGNKQLANNQTSYDKWVGLLKIPHFEKFRDGHLHMTVIDSATYNPQKTCRPSEIVKSEQRISAVLLATWVFLNPFGSNMDSQRLYNLSTGASDEQGIAESMINLVEHGTHKYKEFVSKRLENGHKQLFAPNPRSQLNTFRYSTKKRKVTAKVKIK